jgi:osmotically-inducible protein OsmY
MDNDTEVNVDELSLRQMVLDELEYEPIIDAADIGVAIDDGVVTLTGHVNNYSEKVAAIEAARRVSGVKAVADEIEVRPLGTGENTDDQVAKKAVNLLKWDTAIPNNAIQVTVRSGRVTLTGQVQWQYQRQAAEAAVRKLAGVVGINNHITVKPPVSVEPSIVKANIESALRRRAEIEAKSIRVTVEDGGRVVLEGKVDNWEELMAVENAAWSAPGVQSIKDNLRIA